MASDRKNSTYKTVEIENTGLKIRCRVAAKFQVKFLKDGSTTKQFKSSLKILMLIRTMNNLVHTSVLLIAIRIGNTIANNIKFEQVHLNN